jgi:hypothetical protein
MGQARLHHPHRLRHLRPQHASTLYDRKRAGGKRHNAALICLARRRCDVILAHAPHPPALPARPDRTRPSRRGLNIDPASPRTSLTKNMGTPPGQDPQQVPARPVRPPRRRSRQELRTVVGRADAACAALSVVAGCDVGGELVEGHGPSCCARGSGRDSDVGQHHLGAALPAFEVDADLGSGRMSLRHSHVRR